MKLVLQKHHWHDGIQYEPGDTIDVSKEDYDFIMNVYKTERGQQVQTEAQAKQVLSSIGELTDEQEKEAEAIGKKV